MLNYMKREQDRGKSTSITERTQYNAEQANRVKFYELKCGVIEVLLGIQELQKQRTFVDLPSPVQNKLNRFEAILVSAGCAVENPKGVSYD